MSKRIRKHQPKRRLLSLWVRGRPNTRDLSSQFPVLSPNSQLITPNWSLPFDKLRDRRLVLLGKLGNRELVEAHQPWFDKLTNQANRVEFCI